LLSGRAYNGIVIIGFTNHPKPYPLVYFDIFPIPLLSP